MGRDRRQIQEGDPLEKDESPVVVIDSHPICYEAMHHFGGLQWEDRHTGVIFHYLNRLLTFVNKFNTTRFVFTWDSRKSYRRDKIFSDYKGNKDYSNRTEEEQILYKHLFEQIYILRSQILPALGFKNVFIKTGYEADDIIASVVMSGRKKYIIISDDNDLYQLLNYAKMWKLKTKKFYTSKDFWEEFNLDPNQWVTVKILAGCSGDNVPGLNGIGTKRAIAWLNDELPEGKFRTKIRFVSEEFMVRNEMLVKLPMTGVGTFKLDFNEQFDLDNIITVCESYGCFSLIKDNRLKAWKEFIE